jgi:hypothetical protein
LLLLPSSKSNAKTKEKSFSCVRTILKMRMKKFN